MKITSTLTSSSHFISSPLLLVTNWHLPKHSVFPDVKVHPHPSHFTWSSLMSLYWYFHNKIGPLVFRFTLTLSDLFSSLILSLNNTNDGLISSFLQERSSVTLSAMRLIILSHFITWAVSKRSVPFLSHSSHKRSEYLINLKSLFFCYWLHPHTFKLTSVRTLRLPLQHCLQIP